jgi:hypothetical protein
MQIEMKFKGALMVYHAAKVIAPFCNRSSNQTHIFTTR